MPFDLFLAFLILPNIGIILFVLLLILLSLSFLKLCDLFIIDSLLNPNNITKVFQESLRNEYNKINQYLIQIKEQYNEKLNTDNKLDISNILIQYHSCINNIKQLFIEYIRQSNNNSYFAMIISYIQSYWKKMSYDKKLLQELLNFLQKRVDNKFFEYKSS